MEFLAGSLLELIVQTSTNLPPDVRAAMSMTAAAETPGTQSAQALDIILSNVDMTMLPLMVDDHLTIIDFDFKFDFDFDFDFDLTLTT